MSAKLSEKLISNHYKYQRDFIWRHKITPYRIMIAEFMLHRTRAEQVEPIYKDFIKKHPDVYKLAKAKLRNLKKVTKKLGLHWRIRHFKKAAQYVIKYYDGRFPADRILLLKIPGIGDYVAGAILTVCFNQKEYVIDSNIARFIDRYYGLKLRGEIRRKKIIIQKAKELFNYKKTKQLLFAILDFTALICKPINPQCAKCIFNEECKYGKNELNRHKK